MHRFLVASVAGVMLMTVSPAFAADETATPGVAPVEIAATPSVVPRLDTAAAVAEATASWPVRLDAGQTPFNPYRRPAALPGLYAATIALQGYDAYSTLAARTAGARETNPLMQAAVKNPAVFVALKAGVATLSILAAERLWKDGHRVRAVVTMVVSNSVTAMVAANNASVLRRLR
jgi:hypothetical protein